MKKKSFWKNTAAWCMALLMIFSVCLPVWAEEADQQKGSVQLQLPAGQDHLEMTLYSVADYSDGSYLFSPDFAKSGIAVTDLNNSEETQEAAQKLAEYAAVQNVEGIKAKPDESGLVNFTGLTPALYLAAQSAGSEFLNIQAALVPIPYAGEEGAFIYDAVLSPKYSFPGGAVIVTKVDEEGKSVGEAQFVLQQKTILGEGETAPEGAETGSNESGSYYWKEFKGNLITSVNGQIVVTDMPMGDYRFVEIQAPVGYVRNGEPAYFSITQAGQVAEVQGVYQEESGMVADVQVVNQQTAVKIIKVDESGNPVSGARLILKDADGSVILNDEGYAKYEIITAKEPYVLKRLPAGDYFLCEVQSPDGYMVAHDVPLTVSGTDPSVYEVTMVDEKEEVTPGSLTVIKRLVDINDNELAATEGVFYVALFEDPEMTSRVSDVKAIEYHDQGTASVTFSNLKMDKTYYVGETDEYGNLMEMMEVEGVICVPLYPDVIEITPTDQEPGQEFTFDNVFYELPDGYYYVGKLTVTKEVLLDDEPFETDAVYYAGVFEDPEHTQLAGDVIILELNGDSQVSTVVEVPIGESLDDVKTYYVCETDENGVPLDNDMDLEFEISEDESGITFTSEEREHEMIITNIFHEEEPEPSGTPTVTPAQATNTPAPGGNNPGTPSSSTGVKTGDDTPIGIFIIILAAAAAVIGGILVYRKKKK